MIYRLLRLFPKVETLELVGTNDESLPFTKSLLKLLTRHPNLLDGLTSIKFTSWVGSTVLKDLRALTTQRGIKSLELDGYRTHQNFRQNNKIQRILEPLSSSLETLIVHAIIDDDEGGGRPYGGVIKLPKLHTLRKLIITYIGKCFLVIKIFF